VRQHPVGLPEVTLETQSGARIHLAGLRGKWLLVGFIYTRCPTYCAVLVIGAALSIAVAWKLLWGRFDSRARRATG
jgi:cytochrome oxidase Cu insertion factor (SCO1/SenC/PrrC family)